MDSQLNQLYKLLLDNNFDKSCIFINVEKHKYSKILKNDYIPDLIYFDDFNKNIILCESKTNNLSNLQFYINNLKLNKYNIYGISFINNKHYTIYKLIKNNLHILNTELTPNIFSSNTEPLEMRNEIHKVHNYIRDNTKISNDDKAFFIAIILISIKKASFQYIFDKYQEKTYIYDILLHNLNEYEIDIEVFKFLKSDENNKHLFNLIEMIFKIYKKNPSIDLLNEFYSEFVKYNNSDGKKLGIVLTPPYIVTLMTEMLNINENDIVLDLCTGTGSFLLEAHKYKPKMLIGCEYQNKLYALLKCNMILRNINNCNLIKGDCFKQEFKATKSLINPPYGMKDKKELDFIIKQLESLEEGGECCAIIPVGKISNSKANNKYKEELMKIADIKSIIICKKDLFYPYASVQCCILHLHKTQNKKYMTNIINFENDGFIVEMNKGVIKTEQFDILKDQLIQKLKLQKHNKLNIDDDWHIEKTELILDIRHANKQLKLMELEEEYNKKRNIILSNNLHDYFDILINETTYKIQDLFNIENIKTPLILNKKYNNGEYPLISASKYNNGISLYIEKQINKILHKNHCLIFSTVGTCFYQSKEFYATSSIKILRPKYNNISKEIMVKISILIMDTFLIKYNKLRGFKYEIFKDLYIKMNKLNNV
jgi:predicted RNA methylase